MSYVVQIDEPTVVHADAEPTESKSTSTSTPLHPNNEQANHAMVTDALTATRVPYTVTNQQDLVFPNPTTHIDQPRSTFIRKSLPDFGGDFEKKNAFLLLVFGTLLCPPLLCVNFHYFNSGNKRARQLARCSICLSIPFGLFLVTTLVAVFTAFTSIAGEKIQDMTEAAVATTTCQQNALCCAGAGSLVRYIDKCANVEIVDPTGYMCRYQLGPCEWKGEVTNTTSNHCHGPVDDSKTICHKHRSTHVNGKEPGEL